MLLQLHSLSLVAYLSTFLAVILPATMSKVHAHPVDTCAAVTLQTRELMDSLFSEFALDNFGESFANALSDDLVWTVTGTSPIAGRSVHLGKVRLSTGI